ncbi:DUF7010 family protein [Jeotgalibacillus marinus]|uniref:Uncharacterized protein n=1 Tax=Jeotgalibacillus marinus TaxID=86667 RepID=A0ABV3Q4Y3_9BACL
MNLVEMRKDLSIEVKNGITFLLAGTLVWILITVIFFQSIDIAQKNFFMLCSTGLTFPLGIVVSKMFNVDWKNKNHPLSELGLYLNVAQFIYFPILFLILVKVPSEAVTVFALITVAHFFLYGWLYHTKVYYILSPIISVLIFVLSLTLPGEKLWMIPLAMVLSLLLMNILLYVDYKKKVDGLIEAKKEPISS